MTRPEIQRLLLDQYTAFIHRLHDMHEVQAHMAAPGKWSPAQQADHLVKSVRPVTMAFGLPRFVIPLLFGRADRPSRSYDEVVSRYKGKLAAGGVAPSPFVPGMAKRVRVTCRRLDSTVQRLSRRAGRFSETQLDALVLPHPLMGKLTLREMLYFTAYHAQHHHEAVKSTHLSE